jgi:outer membrane protein TolC
MNPKTVTRASVNHSLMTFNRKKMSLRVLTIASFSLLLLFSELNAQENPEQLNSMLGQDRSLNLNQAINVALANNAQIKRALLSIDDADELIKIAYSEVLPDVTSSVNYVRNIEIPVSFLPAEIFDPTQPPGTFIPVAFGTDNNWQGGITVSQNIFRGEAIVGIASSTVFRKVQEELYRATAQQIVTQTRTAYYQVLIAKENLRLQEIQIRRLEENLADNEARFRAGLIEEYDVLRIRVQLSNERPLLIDAEYALEEAYRNLNVVLGLPVDFDFMVEGNLNNYDILNPLNDDAENTDLRMVDQMNPYKFEQEMMPAELWTDSRGDLRVLESQLDLKDKEITAIQSRFLPTISANYGLTWNAVEAGALDPFQDAIRAQTIGVSVSLPLFSGLERISNVTRAKIQRKDLEVQKREAMLNAKNEIATARQDLNQVLETAQARQEALDQAQRGYDIAKSRFDNGLGTQLDLTEAELQVRQAELNYASLIFNYLTAKARYDLATGQVPYIDIQN